MLRFITKKLIHNFTYYTYLNLIHGLHLQHFKIEYDFKVYLWFYLQTLLKYGDLSGLANKRWRFIREVPASMNVWFPSLDLAHGHLCQSYSDGITMYDRDLREAITYNSKLPAADSEAASIDMGWCHQVAALDDGQLAVAADKGLYRITHQGMIFILIAI